MAVWAFGAVGYTGNCHGERSFLAFFGFAVDFQYFFRKTDEMMIEYEQSLFARAFMCGMLITAVVTLIYAVAMGSASYRDRLGVEAHRCWFYALSTAWYGIKESCGGQEID